MNLDDSENLMNMIKFLKNKEVCPCFDRVEIVIDDISPIGDFIYNIYLYQDYSKSNETAKDRSRFFITSGSGETLKEAMLKFSSNTKFLK